MTNADILALIERLEKLEGHDHSVDWAICDLLGEYEPVPFDQNAKAAYPYTSSIDAALTLVPEGYEGEIFWHYGNKDRLGYVELKKPNPLWGPDCPPDEEMRYGGFYFSYSDESERYGDVAKPLPIPIAICIAALKSRMGANRGNLC